MLTFILVYLGIGFVFALGSFLSIYCKPKGKLFRYRDEIKLSIAVMFLYPFFFLFLLMDWLDGEDEDEDYDDYTRR